MNTTETKMSELAKLNQSLDAAAEASDAAGKRIVYESDAPTRHDYMASRTGNRNDLIVTADAERGTVSGFRPKIITGFEVNAPSGAAVDYTSTISGLHGSTEIARHLPGGGEYRHISNDREMAYKVGHLAAKTITERNQGPAEQKAA